MKKTLFNTVRRWRWEWLYIILALVVFGCSGYSCLRHTFRPRITSEESKIRFDNRMSEIEDILKNYGVDYHEVNPWDNMRYMRRVLCKFSNGSMDIILENENGTEKYTLIITMVPGQTPEQSLPDAASLHMACEVQNILSGGEFAPEFLEETLVSLMDDARNQFSVFEPRSEPGYIYSDDKYGIHLDVHQNKDETYTTYIKFITYKFE
ncbi:MAG: hypothetical protein K0S22_265 [Oscillospiraceae bacterium]|nr:hypothetical protein [Oscillospiraceae bacterium]